MNAKCFFFCLARFNCCSYTWTLPQNPNLFSFPLGTLNNWLEFFGSRNKHEFKINVCAHSEHFSHSNGMKFPFVSIQNTYATPIAQAFSQKNNQQKNEQQRDDGDDNEKRSHQTVRERKKEKSSHRDIIISDNHNYLGLRIGCIKHFINIWY